MTRHRLTPATLDGAPTSTLAAEPTPALLVSTPEAARLCGISPATWHRLAAAGKIGPARCRLGARILYRAAELAEWTEARTPDGRLLDRREWDALQAQQRAGRR